MLSVIELHKSNIDGDILILSKKRWPKIKISVRKVSILDEMINKSIMDEVNTMVRD